MAELYPPERRTVKAAGSGAVPQIADAEPGLGQTHALWRSILSPTGGQRVLILDRAPDGLREFLLGEGVRFHGREEADAEEGGAYDVVLEGIRARKLGPRPAGNRSSLVGPGGRWVAIVEGSPLVGLQGKALLRRVRKEGFKSVETLYAHPSLLSPEILVPLDRVEPIGYFLELAMGERTFRKRCVALGFLLLARLGLHRGLLPNLILIARR